MELESSVEIKKILREIYFLGAKEIDAAGKKAICVYVPVPQQKTFQKIQVKETEGCRKGKGRERGEGGMKVSRKCVQRSLNHT